MILSMSKTLLVTACNFIQKILDWCLPIENYGDLHRKAKKGHWLVLITSFLMRF